MLLRKQILVPLQYNGIVAHRNTKCKWPQGNFPHTLTRCSGELTRGTLLLKLSLSELSEIVDRLSAIPSDCWTGKSSPFCLSSVPSAFPLSPKSTCSASRWSSLSNCASRDALFSSIYHKVLSEISRYMWICLITFCDISRWFKFKTKTNGSETGAKMSCIYPPRVPNYDVTQAKLFKFPKFTFIYIHMHLLGTTSWESTWENWAQCEKTGFYNVIFSTCAVARLVSSQRVKEYVLIDWVGGPDGKIFGPRAKYFPVRPDVTQSISILSYDQALFRFFFFFFLGGGGE